MMMMMMMMTMMMMTGFDANRRCSIAGPEASARHCPPLHRPALPLYDGRGWPKLCCYRAANSYAMSGTDLGCAAVYGYAMSSTDQGFSAIVLLFFTMQLPR
eukprot:2588414-Rhodomonas_salina.3